jgi:ribokinase
MKAMSFSPANHCNLKLQKYPIKQPAFANPIHFNNHQNQKPSNKKHQFPSFSIKASKTPQTPLTKYPNTPPLVVVGSANADIYVEIDRLPKEGETISAKTGQTLAGGKGANQAACGAKLSYPTYFVGQVGEDAHGKLITEALKNGGVNLDCVRNLSDVPTGHAVVMLQPDGQNSIIIVGGANMSCWPEKLSDEDLEVVRKAGVVLLQREIPDLVNIQVAKVRHFNEFFFLISGILMIFFYKNSVSHVVHSCLMVIMLI